MNIQEKYLTINPYSRCGEKLESVKKLVIHWVGNAGSSAIGNRNYFESLKDKGVYASSQFIIGLDGEIIACMPEDEIAWHAGNLSMNYNSIGIEVCHPDWTGKYSDITYNSLIELLKYLCDKYNLTSNDIIRHYDVTGKICPKYYVENPNEFEKIKSDVDSNYSVSIPDNTNVNTNTNIGSFTVRVDKSVANVRTQPNSNSPLGGSQKLYQGYTFVATGVVEGESVNGNNLWYHSAVGNYVWSGGLTQISGNSQPQTNISTPATTEFTVKVNKSIANVRTQPNSTSSLGGSQKLYQGDTFVSVGTIVGENVNGNNIWYISKKGNYVWSGGLARI